MINFQLQMPTQVLFGKGELEKIGIEASKFGKTALVVTGRSSTKKTGVLDRVVGLLEGAGLRTVVFDQIEPNPRSTTVDAGGALARQEGCDLVIALGGGSVMDAGKAIAAVAISGHPIHEYIAGNKTGKWKELLPIKEAMPIITIPTLAATGSEANSGAVITNWETHEKAGVSGPALYPKIAILDPELTYTVSASYTADGCSDIFTHLYESYITGDEQSYVQDELTEGLMRSVIRYAKTAIEHPTDYESRAAILWTSTLALVGVAQAGRGGSYPVHQMEHVLSGYFDISHGRGLAVLTPAYFRMIREVRPHRLARLGRQVFQVREEDDQKAADQTIEAVIRWYEEIGVWTNLKQLGITRESLAEMADEAVRVGGRGNGFISGAIQLREKDVLVIYEESFE